MSKLFVLLLLLSAVEEINSACCCYNENTFTITDCDSELACIPVVADCGSGEIGVTTLGSCANCPLRHPFAPPTPPSPPVPPPALKGACCCYINTVLTGCASDKDPGQCNLACTGSPNIFLQLTECSECAESSTDSPTLSPTQFPTAAPTASPTPFPTYAPDQIEPCNASDPLYWSTHEPVLHSEDIQEPRNETIATISISDLHSASFFERNNTLTQEVYWSFSVDEFIYEETVFNIDISYPPGFENSTIDKFYDVAADLIAPRRVYFTLTFLDAIIFYIVEMPAVQPPLNHTTLVPLYIDGITISSYPPCAFDPLIQHRALLDTKCSYRLHEDGFLGGQIQYCVVAFLACNEFFLLATVFTDTLNFTITGVLTSGSIVLDVNDSLSLVSEFEVFPSVEQESLLFNVSLLFARGFRTPEENEQYPNISDRCDWYYAKIRWNTSEDLEILFDESYPRSPFSAFDAGNIVLKTEADSLMPTGQACLLLPSATRGAHVDFFNPLDFENTFQEYDTQAKSYIYHLSASRTDYNVRNLHALFAASFWHPENRLFVGFIAQDLGGPWPGGLMRSTFYGNESQEMYEHPPEAPFFKQIDRFSLGTEYEFIVENGKVCTKIDPLLSVTLTNGAVEVLRVTLEDAETIDAPTFSPTASPVSSVDPWAEVPLRQRDPFDQQPLPKSVLKTNLMNVECENNTWVRKKSIRHCDACEPYPNEPQNNDSKPLWYAFETSDMPAMYFTYTDPAEPTCTRRDCDAGRPYQTAPLEATVLSLWSQCASPHVMIGDSAYSGEDCSSEGGHDNLAPRHSLLGPLCLRYSSLYRLRVRGQEEPDDVGDFDLTIEEWLLRRGGDHCREARPLDIFRPQEAENFQRNCESAIYTNLCAPNCGVDMLERCPAIGNTEVPTVWFSYQTSVHSTDLLEALIVMVTLNDTCSNTLTEPTWEPFKPLDERAPLKFVVSVWKACETVLEEPLYCNDIGQLLTQFPFVNAIINNNVEDQPYEELKLKPHTLYYIAVSTNYEGDYAICVKEDAREECRKKGFPGHCQDLCDEIPCDPEEALGSKIIVESFPASDGFTAGLTGSKIGDLVPGVDITARGLACRCCLRPMLFDTENPSGDDCELGTPNTRFGGPGCGLGGAEGRGVNFVPQGLCLMISEDDDSEDPDAERTAGLVLRFDFCQEVQLLYIVFVNARDGTKITLYDEHINDYPEIPLYDRGNNGVNNVTLNDPRYAPPLVRRMDVELSGTGGHGTCITEFAYRVPILNDICNCDDAPFIDHSVPTTRGAGACCYDGGAACEDFQSIEQCDAVRGDYSPQRSCDDETLCPHATGQASSIFGWQEDSEQPLENERHLRRKNEFGFESSSSHRRRHRHKHHHKKKYDD